MDEDLLWREYLAIERQRHLRQLDRLMRSIDEMLSTPPSFSFPFPSPWSFPDRPRLRPFSFTHDRSDEEVLHYVNEAIRIINNASQTTTNNVLDTRASTLAECITNPNKKLSIDDVDPLKLATAMMHELQNAKTGMYDSHVRKCGIWGVCPEVGSISLTQWRFIPTYYMEHESSVAGQYALCQSESFDLAFFGEKPASLSSTEYCFVLNLGRNRTRFCTAWRYNQDNVDSEKQSNSIIATAEFDSNEFVSYDEDEVSRLVDELTRSPERETSANDLVSDTTIPRLSPLQNFDPPSIQENIAPPESTSHKFLFSHFPATPPNNSSPLVQPVSKNEGPPIFQVPTATSDAPTLSPTPPTKRIRTSENAYPLAGQGIYILPPISFSPLNLPCTFHPEMTNPWTVPQASENTPQATLPFISAYTDEFTANSSHPSVPFPPPKSFPSALDPGERLDWVHLPQSVGLHVMQEAVLHDPIQGHLLEMEIFANHETLGYFEGPSFYLRSDIVLREHIPILHKVTKPRTIFNNMGMCVSAAKEGRNGHSYYKIVDKQGRLIEPTSVDVIDKIFRTQRQLKSEFEQRLPVQQLTAPYEILLTGHETPFRQQLLARGYARRAGPHPHVDERMGHDDEHMPDVDFATPSASTGSDSTSASVPAVSTNEEGMVGLHVRDPSVAKVLNEVKTLDAQQLSLCLLLMRELEQGRMQL